MMRRTKPYIHIAAAIAVLGTFGCRWTTDVMEDPRFAGIKFDCMETTEPTLVERFSGSNGETNLVLDDVFPELSSLRPPPPTNKPIMVYSPPLRAADCEIIAELQPGATFRIERMYVRTEFPVGTQLHVYARPRGREIDALLNGKLLGMGFLIKAAHPENVWTSGELGLEVKALKRCE